MQIPILSREFLDLPVRGTAVAVDKYVEFIILLVARRLWGVACIVFEGDGGWLKHEFSAVT